MMDSRCRVLASGAFDWCSVGRCAGNGDRALVADPGLAVWWRRQDGDRLRACEARRRLAVAQAVWAWQDHLLMVATAGDPPAADDPAASPGVRLRVPDDGADAPDPEPPAGAVPPVAPWLELALTGPPPGLPGGRFLRPAPAGGESDYDAHIARAAYAALLGRVCTRRAACPVVQAPLADAADRPGLPARVDRHNRPGDLLREFRGAGGQAALLEALRGRYARALAAVE